MEVKILGGTVFIDGAKVEVSKDNDVLDVHLDIDPDEVARLEIKVNRREVLNLVVEK